MTDTAITLDAFFFGGTQDDPELLSLFHRWRDAWMHTEDLTDDYEIEDAVSAADEIARQIIDAPTMAPIGLAVKAFMAGFDLYMNSAFSLSAVGTDAMRGLLLAAARTVPEIAPLVANIVSLPPVWQIRGHA